MTILYHFSDTDDPQPPEPPTAWFLLGIAAIVLLLVVFLIT